MYIANLFSNIMICERITMYKEVLWGVIYRDGGFLVLKEKKLVSEIKYWRDIFQEKIKFLAGNYCLMFNVKIFKTEARLYIRELNYALIITKLTFPFFHLEVFCYSNG